MSSPQFDPLTEIHDAMLQTLSATSPSVQALGRLRDLQSRFGAAMFREAAVQLFARLAPQDQQRLAVNLGVHGHSRTLAA